MKKVQTYTGDITEFVDWVSGTDVITGEDATTGLPVSGGSIRDLLLKRLKSPIYLFYDTVNGYYRGFSSEDAYKMWVENPTEYSDLQQFYFVAPSPYTILVTGLPSDIKYIEKSSLSTDGKLEFSWLINSNNETNLDYSITVVYKINDAVIDTVTYNKNNHNISYDISSYLTSGNNEILLQINAVEVTASSIVKANIYCVQLDLTSEFEYYNTINKESDVIINIPYQLTGSDGNIRYVCYSIDGNTVLKTTIKETNSYSINGNLLIPTVSLSSGKHNILIYAETIISNVSYYSDLLYYDFVINGLSDSSYKTILIKYIFSGLKNNIFTSTNKLLFSATQYESFDLSWSYYTAHPQIDASDIDWYLLYNDGDLIVDKYIITLQGVKNQKSDDLSLFPEIYSSDCYIIPKINDSTIDNDLNYPIVISKSSTEIAETTGYVFKLSATSMSNGMSESLRNKWEYIYKVSDDYQPTYTTDFINFEWNNNSGWVNKALVLSEGAKAIVHFNPLSNSSLFGGLNFNNSSNIKGRTFEIEFETFSVEDTNKNIITLGSSSGASIQITPNSAIVTNQSGTTIIKTNFKENEKVRLSFIINQNNGSDLYINNKIFIVNNGTLERAASTSGCNFGVTDELDDDGKISNGIIIDGTYSGIKIYSIKCYDTAISYDNAFYNYVIESGNISELIKKNNVYSNGQINEALCENKLDVILMTGDVKSVLDDSSTDKLVSKPIKIQRICRETPAYNFTIVNGRLRKHGQSTLNYAVPSFKIWTDYYNSTNTTEDGGVTTMYSTSDIDNLSDEELSMYTIYKGRYQMKANAIPAKKFVLLANYADSSGVHNGGIERLIHNTWYNATVNNKYVLRTDPQQYSTSTGDYIDNGWNEAMNTSFPYIIRNSPDSFPCVLFYRQNETDTYTFLGQYVFMDDKKAEHIYGQRSIYKVASDPFCLTEQFKSYDKAENRLWDNKNVLRMEIILLNNNFVNYTSMKMGNNNWNDVIANSDGSWQFAWQKSIELIYPDQEDLADEIADDYKKLFLTDIPDSTLQSLLLDKVKETVAPFTNWVKWLADTYALDNGGEVSQALFLKTAADHLDLYKLAAYYIFCLRFGLVDSMQRNAQVKTYDGVHFHYEPWDMDIAMGSRNTGGIAYNPPITRLTLTQEDMTSDDSDGLNNYALSGHDCWLWNALENWKTSGSVDGWIDRIVPKVAQALYLAGLTYDNAISMFDDNYQNKWCERIYNDSGYFKYLQEGNGSYVRFLNGSRTTHRHWWLKRSFDYWDSVWSCGEFTTKNIGMLVDKPQWAETGYTGYNPGKYIELVSSSLTYFSVSLDSTLIQSDLVSAGETVRLTYTDSDFANLSTKQYNFINGAVNISKVNIECITLNLERLDIGGCYDSTLLLSNLKVLDIGMPWEGMTLYGIFHKFTSGLSIIYTGCTFDRLEELNIQGMYMDTEFINFLVTLTSLKIFKAAGSNITVMKSSTNGNKYTLLLLPDSITTLTLNNSSWNTLEFYTKSNGKLSSTPMSTIPSSLNEVQFNGTTGTLDCCKEFVFNWINSLDGNYSDKSLLINNINWTDVTYDDVIKLGTFYKNSSSNTSFGGYIKLTAGTLSSDETTRNVQLNNIKTLFGPNVFTLALSGLKIDYAFDFIALTTGDNTTIVNNNITMYEGYSTLITATRFALTTDENNSYTWQIFYYDEDGKTTGYTNPGTKLQGCQITSSGLFTVEEGTYSDGRKIGIRAIKVDDDGTRTYGISNIIINKRKYPTSIVLKGNFTYDSINDKYIIKSNGDASFSVTSNYSASTAPSGSITSYVWEIADNTCFTEKSKTANSAIYNIHDIPTKSTSTTVKITIKYANNSSKSSTIDVMLINEKIVLENMTGLGDDRYAMYVYYGSSITPTWAPEKDGYIYSSDLSKFSNTVDLSSYTNKSNITTFTDEDDDLSLLDYMVNATGVNLTGFNKLKVLDASKADWYTDIILDDCIALTSLIFATDSELQTLSIKNDTKLSQLDYTNLSQLVSLNTQGTTMDCILEDKTKLTEVLVGIPTTLTFKNCSSLNIHDVVSNSFEYKVESISLSITGTCTASSTAHLNVLYNSNCLDSLKGVTIVSSDSSVTIDDNFNISTTNNTNRNVTITATSTYDTTISSSITMNVGSSLEG